jgi:hypothetical protein
MTWQNGLSETIPYFDDRSKCHSEQSRAEKKYTQTMVKPLHSLCITQNLRYLIIVFLHYISL